MQWFIYYSVEGFLDGLTFYIDNQQIGQYQPTGSGEYPWIDVSYSVGSGNHTFKWTYSKDGGGGSTDCSNTGCDDAAFIDDIVFPSVESEFNGIVGDINGDQVVNVIDVIMVVNMALGSQEINYNTADLNNDGIINILDIIQVVNIILDGRISDATEAVIKIGDDYMAISADGTIAGIQMRISHNFDFSFNLTNESMVSDYNTQDGLTTIIIVLPEEEQIMSFNGNFEIEEIIVANSYGEIDVVIPSKIELSSPYPNPFNPVTTLELYIYNDAYVSVKVYNIMGQVVDVLINENLNKGSHVLNWNASYLPSGLYFVEAKSDYNIITQKVTLLK